MYQISTLSGRTVESSGGAFKREQSLNHSSGRKAWTPNLSREGEDALIFQLPIPDDGKFCLEVDAFNFPYLMAQKLEGIAERQYPSASRTEISELIGDALNSFGLLDRHKAVAAVYVKGPERFLINNRIFQKLADTLLDCGHTIVMIDALMCAREAHWTVETYCEKLKLQISRMERRLKVC